MPKFDIATAGIVPTVTLSDAADQDHSTRDAQFAGLHNDLMFLWAMADTANGKRYQLVRTLSASAAFDFTLHECPPDLWAYPRPVRVPGEQDLYWGPIVWTKVDGEHTVLSGNVTMAAKHAMTVSLGPSRYVWKEDDVIDVTLTPLPSNVTRISVPGPPDDVGYTSSGCTVTGTIEGSPVVGGYGGLDRMYCLPGLSAHVSKIAQLEHYWFVWGALFDDGHLPPAGGAGGDRGQRGRRFSGGLADPGRGVAAAPGDVVVRRAHLRFRGHPQRGGVCRGPGDRLAARHRAGTRRAHAGEKLGHNGSHPAQLEPGAHRGNPGPAPRLEPGTLGGAAAPR